MVGDYLEDVESGRLASTHASGPHGKRTVVVHEKDDLASLVVLHAGPHSTSGSVPLVPAIFADVLLAVFEHAPSGLPVGHAHRMRTRQCLEVVEQSGVADHPTDILTLLEAHEIEISVLVVGPSNEVAGGTTIAAANSEQVPPEEVVGQDLHPQARLAAAALNLPTRLRLACAAPAALGEDALVLWVPEKGVRARGGQGESGLGGVELL
mmetsp:Transcript_65923/g.137659  ORF Transcript_65923/g.137659 Transcript_65923/m.137659 type:complete len:209 (-) Transcript_65923:649-1275(-)